MQDFYDLVNLSAAHRPAAGSGVDWRHNAVCREEDPELFFPIGNTGPALLQIEEAKAVCRLLWG